MRPVTDEVDELVEAWQRERPDLDVSPLHVLSRLTRFAQQVDQARRRAFTAHDLDPWEFDVLAALRRSGGPYALAAGRLGTITGVTSGTMTNRIDRLEDRGLVRREPDPSDRRGVQVVLTPAGRTSVDSALADLVDEEQQILSALSIEDTNELVRVLRILLSAQAATAQERAK